MVRLWGGRFHDVLIVTGKAKMSWVVDNDERLGSLRTGLGLRTVDFNG